MGTWLNLSHPVSWVKMRSLRTRKHCQDILPIIILTLQYFRAEEIMAKWKQIGDPEPLWFHMSIHCLSCSHVISGLKVLFGLSRTFPMQVWRGWSLSGGSMMILSTLGYGVLLVLLTQACSNLSLAIGV
jgi:hypothetical protein